REMLERAIAILERNAPTSVALANAYNVLGAYFYDRREFVNARTAAERSIALFENSNEPTNMTVIAPLLNLGDMLRLQGDLERAHGPDHPDLAETLVHVGRARALVDGPAATEPLLRRALAIQRRAFPADSEVLVPTLTALGQVLGQGHKEDEARPLLEEAVRI